MTESTRVEYDSRERVTFDLMELIANFESDEKENERYDRKYWLTLYHQCNKITLGQRPE